MSHSVQAALRVLVSLLREPAPRGTEVRAATRALGAAGRGAGLSADAIAVLLADAVLPVLRAHHPGLTGEWLWMIVAARAREAHAVAGGTGAPPEPRHRPLPALDARPHRLSSVHRLDARDRITRVNTAWRTFAHENGVAGLADRVLGSSLWDHVHCEDVRRLTRALHRTVRQRGLPVTVPMRCDAPGERRWFDLVVRPLGGGALQVASVERASEPRPAVALLDPAVPRGAGEVPICSWCRRVRVEQAGGVGLLAFGLARRAALPAAWVEVEEGGQGNGAGPLPRLVEQVCDDCAGSVMARIAGLGA